MEFAPAQIVGHLRRAGLLTAIDLVDGGLQLKQGAGRHLTYRAVRGDGSGWFLKVVPSYMPWDSAALTREAAFYARVRDDNGWRALRDIVPGSVRFDATEQLLALELIQGAGNAHELDDALDADASASITCAPIGALLGAALAACHSVPCGDWPEATHGGDRLPWIINVARPHPGWLADLSMAELKLLNALQADSALCDGLDALADDWAPLVLTHADIKWGNVLVRVDATSRRPARIWIVDWEGAFVGDPAWDVGSAFHSFLAEIIHSVAADDSPDAASRAFAASLPAARVEIGACWNTYLNGRGIERASAAPLLARTVGACAARLVQSAMEWSQGRDSVSRSSATGLQLASSIFRSPERAARELLGLPGPAL